MEPDRWPGSQIARTGHGLWSKGAAWCVRMLKCILQDKLSTVLYPATSKTLTLELPYKLILLYVHVLQNYTIIIGKLMSYSLCKH